CARERGGSSPFAYW
nr:immunoglobulin heavy chain junction region [Mus musculus]MBK4198339.1 immunoglobulin heavy chain junction region [Mus musculus]